MHQFGGMLSNIFIIQWALVIGSSLLLIWFSPKSGSVKSFFQASSGTKSPGLWLLTSSLVISWIFAKSITNAANLGLKYGIIGGLAYAMYYLSFLVAGLVIFQMRTKGGYRSIHHFLESKFGKSAVIIFSILIGFRLFNEVWSNTLVIGGYFGEAGTTPFYLAIFAFTVLTLIYSLKGGLKSSLFTDAIQMVLFGVLLLTILTLIFPHLDSTALESNWTFSGGLDLLLVAIIQSLSYPFHDPVMTDRAFITDPKTMRKAFLIAVPIGFLCIVLFSFVGVYARQLGVVGDATVHVAETLGIAMMLLINFIMITSASSTLDSAFASTSKLVLKDLHLGSVTLTSGRMVMIGMSILGTIPVFFGPEVLSATTISGTMVIGLAPVFIFWNKSVPPITFLLVVLTGVVFGVLYTVEAFEKWNLFEGDYGSLLATNLAGSITCFGLFGFMRLIKK